LLRVQLVSHFDVFVVSPGHLEREVCGCELNEAEPEVTGVAIMIVGLDVANAVVIVLKLALNEKIGVGGRRHIKIIVVAGSLAIERDLEVFPAGLSDRYVIGVEFHRVSPLASVHL
jgi:hypothetical protein